MCHRTQIEQKAGAKFSPNTTDHTHTPETGVQSLVVLPPACSTYTEESMNMKVDFEKIKIF